MDKKTLTDELYMTICFEPSKCPWQMMRQSEDGSWYCSAKFPDGDVNGLNHGCIGLQAAKMLENSCTVVPVSLF